MTSSPNWGKYTIIDQTPLFHTETKMLSAKNNIRLIDLTKNRPYKRRVKILKNSRKSKAVLSLND